jgi:hypothetical protein
MKDERTSVSCYVTIIVTSPLCFSQKMLLIMSRQLKYYTNSNKNRGFVIFLLHSIQEVYFLHKFIGVLKLNC